MAGGHPTLYSQEMVENAKAYLLSADDFHTTNGKLQVRMPTKGGLAFHLKVSRDTLYEWASIHPEFSDIMEELSSKQEARLINNGLSGDYNPTIAKVLLTKHGYSDKQEIDHTTKGESINDPAISKLTAELNAIHRGTSESGNGGTTSPLGAETQNQE